MPCWEVKTMSVKFQAKYCDLLDEAIAGLGWRVEKIREDLWRVFPQGASSFVLDLEDGVAMIEPRQQRYLNKLKVAYSQAAIKKVAKKRGWKTKFTGPTKGRFVKKQWG